MEHERNSLSPADSSPVVSILIPVLNAHSTIRQCVNSVLSQTLHEIEVICIDAGSTDGTAEILRDYEAADARFHLLHSERKSYGHQVNLGLSMAYGTYIGIVEADDYIAPEMFESLYRTAEQTVFPDVVKSGYCQVTAESGECRTEIILPVHVRTGDVFPLSAHYELLLGHPSIWSAIYRKDFLTARGIRMAEVPGAGWVDNPFLYHTLCQADRIAWVDDAFYFYRDMNPNSSSAKLDCEIPILRINEMKDFIESFDPDNRYLERMLFQRAGWYVYLVLKNPNCTKADVARILKTLRRFRVDIICMESLLWLQKKLRKKYLCKT